MRVPDTSLAAAVHAAAQAVAGKGGVLEVFCRSAHTYQLTAPLPGQVLQQETHELGVACRVQKENLVGFGRAAGDPREAGRQAAQLALAFLSPGHPPLPAAHDLGAVELPRPREVHRATADALFHTLSADPRKQHVAVTLINSETLLHRSEGFAAGFPNQLLVASWHQELLPGVVVVFRRVCPMGVPAHPSCLRMLEPSQKRSSLKPERQLTRVLLAPDVAAPLLVSLARFPELPQRRVGEPWDLWDLRVGEEALLPMACDGEGYPACNRPVLTPQKHGQAHVRNRGSGAVRVPWDALPATHPVHLYQRPSAASPEDIASFEGVMALVPASEVVLEDGGHFRCLTLAVECRGGKAVKEGLVVIKGSLARLPACLVATTGPVEHVALGCVVSTPWLLVKNLEVG